MDGYDQVTKADAIYMDTSALVKLSKGEDGTDFVNVLLSACTIPFYTSSIAFGEYISVFAREDAKKRLKTDIALLAIRKLLYEFKLNRLKMIEPSEDGFTFVRSCQDLVAKYPELGMGDVWHIMAAQNLKLSAVNSLLFSYDPGLVSAAVKEGLAALDGKTLSGKDLLEKLKASGKCAF